MCELNSKDIITKIHEMKEIHKELKLLGNRIADHLGVDILPIEFVELSVEDSRLELKPTSKIQISDRYLTKYNKAAYCLAHGYRHVFQIYWASIMDDDLARLFKEDLASAKNSENINVNDNNELMEYSVQVIEVDAEAFATYYLKKYENIELRKKPEWFQRLIEAYIRKYKDRL